MVVGTRRAFLGAGALLLVGCGPPEEATVVPSEVWGEQLRAAQAVRAAYEGVDGVDKLRARADARVKLLETMGPAVSAAPSGPTGLEAALDAEHTALRAHVAAVGLLRDAKSRTLLGTLIADNAPTTTELSVMLKRQPVAEDFVGQARK